MNKRKGKTSWTVVEASPIVETSGSATLVAAQWSCQKSKKGITNLASKKNILGLSMSVINLDIEKGITKVKEEEEEETEMEIIERAARVLCEEARSDSQLVMDRLEKLMKVLRAEIVEKDEKDE